jgi:serine/threonine-protein kinase RsbW
MRIELKNDLKEMGRLLDGVESWGQEQGLSPKMIFDLHLVLDEIFTNIVNYGYDDAAEHQVLIDVEREADDVRVRVEDDARAFNPLERPDPDLGVPLEERKVGGLGIYLVRQLMDEVEYTREGGKNVLSLRRGTGPR